jgi:hypothetical protein
MQSSPLANGWCLIQHCQCSNDEVTAAIHDQRQRVRYVKPALTNPGEREAAEAAAKLKARRTERALLIQEMVQEWRTKAIMAELTVGVRQGTPQKIAACLKKKNPRCQFRQMERNPDKKGIRNITRPGPMAPGTNVPGACPPRETKTLCHVRWERGTMRNGQAWPTSYTHYPSFFSTRGRPPPWDRLRKSSRSWPYLRRRSYPTPQPRFLRPRCAL